MNNTSGAAWSGTEQFDPLGAADQDFGHLLDFGHIDLDFPLDYNQTADSHDASQQLTELADSLDVQHLQNHFSPQISQDQARDGGAGAQQHGNMAGNGMAPENFFDFSMPPYSQASAPSFTQAQDHMYRPHGGVPPTPNSIEMHGDPARYLQQMDPQQAMFDQRFHMRKEDASFTPLVSPAVTPHEARFQIPDFTTVPGAYFSPLTSPALNAQNHQQAQGQTGHYTTSGSSTGTSPAGMDVEMLGEAAVAQPAQGRRLRSTKRNAPRSSNATTRVRQSPIVKPGRRKATVSSLIPPKEVSELVEEAQRSRGSRPSSSGLEVPHSRDSSEVDSVSPEPLSEMGPPPKPGSVTQSPAMVAQAKHRNNEDVAPATPASLMRLVQSPNVSGALDGLPALEDLTLPEASLDRPVLSRLETAARIDDQETPRMTARKTPKLGASSTPSAGAALSGKPSPMLSAVASPTSPAFSMNGSKKGESKVARNLKKRNSVGSALVSPALRPKISPSIKPLLPEGGVSDDTHALLLASKSNYQNILDGTTVPGVVYPTSLSTNLTSKRTSHKIAEQGRRNRINTALLEMQALLPSPQIPAQVRETKSPDSSSAAQSNNSKAAKVESAIDYIKQLQKQCSDKDRLLDQKDQEMEALRKELAAFKRSDSAGSSNPSRSAEQMKAEASSSPVTSIENAT
ncbi:hypothetical protein K491DRAFT_712807 [Lophiostoma macrostomum CBS 122681]|uniref:BHLH domain-containing protein n=1 Tax=Lophiostoma macrostomum CBS 122681 TaxID=1314788 RepID=A0A6A6TJ89_9PLEO|nr:hypothetical protein K491DRAFT_712807 [Lophiostoma macrostomum CBS 122681]